MFSPFWQGHEDIDRSVQLHWKRASEGPALPRVQGQTEKSSDEGHILEKGTIWKLLKQKELERETEDRLERDVLRNLGFGLRQT